MIRQTIIFAAVLFSAGTTHSWERTSVPEGFVMPKPLSFADSVASVKARQRLKVQLVAAEPLVRDPVSFDFGPDGKLWVVEMADYPLGMDGKGKAGGRARFLEDRNGDGVFDSSTLFLDNLNFPTGIKAWRDGVLIVACPEILFARDTDGDGKADEKRVLFRGFKEGNQQHRVNGFVWGLDNWLHLANGDSGGTVESVMTGEKVELGSFDLKINPDTGEMKLTSGRTQYGRVRNDFGNWFGNNNSKPLWQFVLPKPLTDRNPHVPFENRIHQVPEPNAVAPRVFPSSQSAPRFNNPHSASHITSACGISVMRDRKLGEEFYGNAFICEPVHNLVHRRVLSRDGMVFHGVRADDEANSEFLVSTDQWFRPVYSVTGPDGALWVADMYRYVIEHPEWIPGPWQKVIDLRAGEDKGRIYRVVREDAKEEEKAVAWGKFSELTIGQLVEKLNSGNGWERDMAHQLLLWKGVSSSDPKLLDFWTRGEGTPAGRIQFLALLDGLSGAPAVLLHDSLTSESPELQSFALSLVNGENLNPAMTGEVVRLSESHDELVRFAGAVCLGKIKGSEAGEALGRFAVRFASDRFDRAALAIALPGHLDSVAEAVAKAKCRELYPVILETAVALKDHDVCTLLLRSDSKEVLSVLLTVLDRRRIAFLDYARQSPVPLSELLADGIASVDRSVISNSQVPTARRISELRFLGRVETKQKSDAVLLLSLVDPRHPPELSRAAIDRLAALGEFSFLDKWPGASPSLHAAMVERGLRTKNGAHRFLENLSNGNIEKITVTVAAREKLLKHWDKKVKEKAELILSKPNAAREEIVKSFVPALKLQGDPKAGKVIFEQACASCHQFEGTGKAIGADLAALSDNSPEALLVAVLDPNRAVEDKYRLQAIELSDDSVTSGMITGESGGSVTLLRLDGVAEEIPREKIREIRNTGRSAMLEGFEAVLDHRKMADLIAFLRAGKGRRQ